MGKPYARELAALGDTLEWAQQVNVDAVRHFAAAAHDHPLVAVGSGGSAAAAHFAAMLHRHVTTRPARHATPLQMLLDEPGLAHRAVLMLSASGKNRDVLAAMKAAIEAEAEVLGGISTRSTSPLAAEIQRYCHGYAFSEDVPTRKDGFLATNSLLATMAVLARGYGADLGGVHWPPETATAVAAAERPTAVVLHAGWSSPIATDLESRLHESTLLNVQATDYRNFGHGRHLWLSRRGEESTILALVTPETAALAKRTLRLIPNDIPIVRMVAATPGPTATLELLLAALKWTGSLADQQSFDPGRPHVPEFGRKLFHLRPPKQTARGLAAPVRRKLARVQAHSGLASSIYEDALRAFTDHLSSATFGAVVLDYDGTLCATRDRFDPLTREMKAACSRLLHMGIRLGIATGRGKSVRKALRDAFEPDTWASVIVGYYNGAELAPLTDDNAPDVRKETDAAIAHVHELLVGDRLLSEFAEIELRPMQITVSPKKTSGPVDLYAYVADSIQSAPNRVQLLRSGHSIDIVAPGASKLGVVAQLEKTVSPHAVLCIGDRGAWPGNDSRLLSHRASLSVDHVSGTLQSCWNLAPSGELGSAATLRYLKALRESDGAARFDVDAVMGGNA